MALKILRWTIVTILVAILAAVAALMVLAALTGSGVDIPWAWSKKCAVLGFPRERGRLPPPASSARSSLIVKVIRFSFRCRLGTGRQDERIAIQGAAVERQSLTAEPAPIRAYETLRRAASGRFRQVRGVDPAISRCAGRQSISGLLLVAGGHRRATMLGYRRSLLPVVWIVVGIVVAAIYDYFDSLGTVGRVLTAATAVLLWPILLFGFDIRISR
jgi:hypothetical protein